MQSVNKFVASAGALLCAISLIVGLSPLPAQASVAHATVVSANPSDHTPKIVLGSGKTVLAFAQIGSTMYAGGRFTAVQNPGSTTSIPRQNFMAFSATTGAVSSLDLSFDGTVQTLLASPDGKALYIGGSFKKVDGVARKAIVKYDVVNNRIDPTFNAPTAGGTVADAKIVNGRLIVAGTFTRYLLALSPTTGADTGFINVTISGVPNTNDITKVLKFATNPARSRLVAVGNFSAVNGKPRKWAFELNLGPTSTLSTWHGARLDVACFNPDLNVGQSVDFSPDGKYFVIATTGSASGPSGLCDGVGRYETANVAGTAGATWANFTGGDSLYSVVATGAAVYVGGHPRWLNNPNGHNSAGPGAVAREGIGAINPTTGKANSWNPGKTRGHGVQKMFVTSSGLWVGSDGQYFAGENRSGIAFCPVPK